MAHLDGVDLMRVVTIAGVIAVHVVTGTNKPTSVPAGAATILLHVNREIFVLITALVLTYTYAARQQWSLRSFWTRRYWLVGTPYVAWTVVYFLADGPPSSVGVALRQLALDLADGGARYHLYFLLVSMQLYLVFPPLLVALRAARRWHLPILAASAAAQLAFTAAIHYHLPAAGPLRWWLDHPDDLLISYQLYVIAGTILALRLDDLSSWVRRHPGVVAAAVVAGVLAGQASYFTDVSLRVMAPLDASNVFQPAVVVESLAVILGMFSLGVWWAGRLRPSWLARGIGRASDASFGIYLAHPLVLQGIFALGGITGLLAALLALPGRYTLVLGLASVLPVVVAITWVAVWFARRSPLSLPLTGRQAIRPDPHRPTWAMQGLRTLALGFALVAVVSWLDLSSVRLAAPQAAFAGPPAPSPAPLSATLAAADAPSPPPGAEAAVDTISVGGLLRSYQVIRPLQPAAPRLPAVVFLHGINADIGWEEARDGLLPLAAAGQVVLVYPVGYEESWNAGRCCGGAQLQDLDDVTFVQAVADRIAADPGVDPARISLAGYSNGGKMAYRLVCDDPGRFSAVAVVLALPMTPCPSDGPRVSLLHVAVRDDPELPYQPGDLPFQANGVLLTPVTSEVDSWRGRDGCTGAGQQQMTGSLTLRRWQCQDGTRVELATYASGGHEWPAGDAATPPAGQLIWSFVSGK